MPKHTRLLVAERVIPPGNLPSESKLFDINMLVNVGGRELPRQSMPPFPHGRMN